MIERDDPPRREDGRRVLRNRRDGTSEFVTHIWSPGTPSEIHEEMLLTVNRFSDDGVAEVFVDYPHKPGERQKSERVIALGDDIAVIVSIAIQYGAPLSILREAVSRSDVNWMGEMREMPTTIVGTILDYMSEREPKK